MAQVSQLQEGIVDSPKLMGPAEKPHLPAKKKAKTSGALKGILVSAAPSSPPRDHES
jgi:hypothetical protein